MVDHMVATLTYSPKAMLNILPNQPPTPARSTCGSDGSHILMIIDEVF